MAAKIVEEEENQSEGDKQLASILDTFQRDRYLRRKRHKEQVNSRIKMLSELRTFKQNHKHLINKIGAITTVAKNRDRLKERIHGGIVDINNKQNRKIFEGVLDEYKILKAKVKRYKEGPSKYHTIQSKYMNIKDKTKDFRIVINGTEISEKQARDKINQVTQEVREKRGIFPSVNKFENRSQSLRKPRTKKEQKLM